MFDFCEEEVVDADDVRARGPRAGRRGASRGSRLLRSLESVSAWIGSPCGSIHADSLLDVAPPITLVMAQDPTTTRIAIGTMTGTSLDGLDLAAVAIGVPGSR